MKINENTTIRTNLEDTPITIKEYCEKKGLSVKEFCERLNK